MLTLLTRLEDKERIEAFREARELVASLGSGFETAPMTELASRPVG